LGGLKLTKQEYRSIAFAIMAATSLTVGSAATVYADGIEDTAKTEHNAADAVAAEAAASAPVGKDKKPEAAITAGTVGTASQDAEDAAMKAWKASRPEEKSVTDGMQALEGKTIVDIVCTGTSEATAATAKAAIAQRAGDSFSTSALEKDRAAVYATGYFYDLYPTFEQVPEGVVITYHLLENPVLKSVTIKGNTVEKTDVLQNMITVKPGMILNGTELQKNIRDMEAQYRKDGYILAKISDLHINRDGALNIVVNEGILEDFKVKGNTKTKDYVVLREMRLKKGEPFNVKKARRSMQRVYNLGFFEDVNMKLNPGVAPNAIVLEIDVVEKRTGSFGIGAGYSSQDGMVGMISLGDTNFRGTGDAVSVQYEFSGDDSDAHGYTFSWRHPYMDKKETVGTFRVYNRTYEYYDYDTNGDEKESYMRKYSGGEITLGRPVSEYSTNYITLRNRNDKYEKHEDDGNVVTKNANGTINWGAHDQKWKDDNFWLDAQHYIGACH
jgi:outer membrane protein insertion porin family